MYENLKIEKLYRLVLNSAKHILMIKLVEQLRSEIDYYSVEGFSGIVSVRIQNESTLELFTNYSENITDESLKLNFYSEIPTDLVIGDVIYFDYVGNDPEDYFDSLELYDDEDDYRDYLIELLDLID